MQTSPVLTFPFPSTESPADWCVGKGFDPIRGEIISQLGFDTTPQWNPCSNMKVQMKSNYVSNKETFNEQLDFQETAQGHGWGTSANETMNADCNIKFTQESVTIYESGVRTINAFAVSSSQKLSETAKDYLKHHGYEEFCKFYGTHFISGQVKGNGFYARWHMVFDNIEAQASFSAAYGEKVKEMGVNASYSSKIAAATSASSVSGSESGSLTAYGFDPGIFPDSADDITAIADKYAAYTGNSKNDKDAFLISISASPWYFLDDVIDILEKNNSQRINSNLGMDADLGDTYSSILFTKNSAHQFCSGNHNYAGMTQYNKMHTVESNSATLLDEIKTALAAANNGGTAVTTDQTLDYQSRADDLYDQYKDTASMFSLNWHYHCIMEDKPEAIIKNVDQTKPVTTGSKGKWDLTGTCNIAWPSSKKNIAIFMLDTTTYYINIDPKTSKICWKAIDASGAISYLTASLYVIKNMNSEAVQNVPENKKLYSPLITGYAEAVPI
jgi:hypothetical protein